MRLIILILMFFMLTGCANFVTDKTIVDPATGQSVTPITKVAEFTFTFRGEPAMMGSYMYYLVVSTQNFTAVNPVYPIKKYFFVPGESKDNQAIADAYYAGDTNKTLVDVYKDYFVSWNSFITYDSTKALRRYAATFSVTTANYEIDHANYAVIGTLLSNALLVGATTELKFKINLPANDFYFNLYAVDNQSISQKNLEDSLGSNKQFTYVNNKTQTESTDIYHPVSAGLDILSYSVRSYEY